MLVSGLNVFLFIYINLQHRTVVACYDFIIFFLFITMLFLFNVKTILPISRASPSTTAPAFDSAFLS